MGTGKSINFFYNVDKKEKDENNVLGEIKLA